MQLHFLIPDPTAFQSGGNRYNDALITALKKKGVHVSHSPFDTNIYYGSPDTTYVLDSIYFEQISKPEEELPPNCIGLIHHLNSMFPGEPGHFERHEESVLQHCNAHLATSAFTKQYLINRGCPPEQITTIEPAIAPRDVEVRAVSKVRALVVANCIPRKGILPFLNALAQSQIQPYFALNIIGSLTHDPDYAEQCKRLILDHQVLQQCVHLLGEQDDETLDKHYHASNLFLSTALFETFGMAIQEALTYKIPVLVHSGGNSSNHVLEEMNGYTFETHEAMAQTFSNLVRDTDPLRQLHVSLQNHVPEYLNSWDDAADVLIDFLRL